MKKKSLMVLLFVTISLFSVKAKSQDLKGIALSSNSDVAVWMEWVNIGGVWFWLPMPC